MPGKFASFGFTNCTVPESMHRFFDDEVRALAQQALPRCVIANLSRYARATILFVGLSGATHHLSVATSAVHPRPVDPPSPSRRQTGRASAAASSSGGGVGHREHLEERRQRADAAAFLLFEA